MGVGVGFRGLGFRGLGFRVQASVLESATAAFEVFSLAPQKRGNM